MGLCTGWIVAPAAVCRRAAPVAAAATGTLAAGAEIALLAGATPAVACAAAAAGTAAVHASWRRRLGRTAAS